MLDPFVPQILHRQNVSSLCLSDRDAYGRLFISAVSSFSRWQVAAEAEAPLLVGAVLAAALPAGTVMTAMVIRTSARRSTWAAFPTTPTRTTCGTSSLSMGTSRMCSSRKTTALVNQEGELFEFSSVQSEVLFFTLLIITLQVWLRHLYRSAGRRGCC